MNANIGRQLVLVDGAKKWGLYDFLQKNIFRFNSTVGKMLLKVSEIKASPEEKINFIKGNYKKVYYYLEKSNIIDRLYEIWNLNIPVDNYSRKMLWVEITDKCNFKCIHCYNSSTYKNSNNLQLSKIYEIIKDGYLNKFNTIQFTGGEPLLHPDIEQIINYVSEYKYKAIEIYTNLSLISDKQLDLIKNNNIHIATTLLGSNSEIFEKCTNIKGGFNIWLKNAIKIKKLGIQFRISVVRMKQNENDIKNIEILLKKYSLIDENTSINPDDVRPTGRTTMDIVPEHPYINEKKIKQVVDITEEKYFFGTIYNSCWGG